MKDRKVYLVMSCTSKKKAEEYLKYISKIMAEHDPDNPRSYWIYDVRVS